MLPNPSHLEAVNPVACGKARARHMSKDLGHYADEGEDMGEHIVCVQVGENSDQRGFGHLLYYVWT